MCKRFMPIASAALFLAFAHAAHSKPIEVPLQLSYDFIRKILMAELYTGPQNTAKVWDDGHDCGFLTLSDPQLSGQNGLLHIVNKMQTRIGARLGGQCVALLKWEGFLDTLQKPTLDARNAVVTLPVVDMKAYDAAGNPLGNEQLWNTARRYVEPKLSRVKLDLQQSKEKIRKTLPSLIPAENAAAVRKAIDSLTLNKIAATEDGVNIAFALDMPELKNVVAKSHQAAAPFTTVEMEQWQANWKHWETFLTEAVNHAAADTKSAQLRDDLGAVLADARNALQEGLSAQTQADNDPVRSFFTRSWPRLAPVLKEISKDLPGGKSLRYFTFIAATDVLHELDNRGALLGLDISSDGLRRLARLLIAEKNKS
jgi:hypothetical protein